MDFAVGAARHTIRTLIRRQSELRSRFEALGAPGRDSVTYRRLGEIVERTAVSLSHAGVRPGGRVAIALPAGPEAIVCTLAVMSHTVAMPLNPASRQAEFEARLSRLKADCLVTVAGSPGEAEKAARGAGIPILFLERPDGAGTGEFRLRPETAGRRPAGAGEPSPEDLALVIETSGTTGEPKRVPLTHANLLASARQSCASMRLTPEDRMLGPLPMHHIAGVGLTLGALIGGSGIWCAPGFDGARFFDWMEECRPSWIFASPAALGDLTAQARAHRAVVERCRLRFIRSGSSSLSERLLGEAEEVFGAPVLEVYGMTEAAPLIACSPLPPGRRKPGSAGLPAGTELMIWSDAGRPAARGEIGEILIRGPNVMRGYEDDPETNAQAFMDGWFRTGDLGRLDEDGYLFITGRLRELINRGGQKISPREVEEVLLRHPDVVEAAVFPMPDARLSENVAALAVLREGAQASERSLRSFAAAGLASYKVPARIRIVAEIPRGSGGKVARLELARRYGPELAGSRPGPAGGGEPETELERRLADIWREVLGVAEVGLHDDFFALGGDSFAAALLLTQVQERFGLAAGELERIDFLDAPTVAGMARVLAECPAGEVRRAESAGPVVALQPRGNRPPFFCVPALGGSPFYLIPLARRLGPGQPFFVLTDNAQPRSRAPESIGETAERYAAAMLKAFPGGPYFLGGHCLGGIVAFETARRLRAKGAQAGLLVLLDTPAPGYPHPLRHWRLFVRGAWRHAAAPEKLEGVRTLGRHLWRFVRARFERAEDDGGGHPRTGADGYLEAAIRAARRYSPGTYPGRIVHLMARSHPRTGSPLDRRLGWKELAERGVEEIWVAGGHLSMLDPPHIESTAERLSALLNGSR